MALRVQHPLPATRPAIAYRRLLVPLAAGASMYSIAVACGLAAEAGAVLTILGVVEVPVALPLDAHMLDEEAELKPVLARAQAVTERHGVHARTKMVRARSAGEAIVEQAAGLDSEIVVLAAPRKKRLSRRIPPFGRTAQYVLRHAPCRVLVAAQASRP